MVDTIDRLSLVEFSNLLSDAVIVTDDNYRVLIWNQAVEKLFAIPGSEAIGRTIGELIQDGKNDTIVEEIRTSIEANGFWRDEKYEISKNGYQIWVDWRVDAFVSPGNESGGTVGILREITRSVKAEEEKITLLNKYGERVKDSTVLCFSPR